MTDEQKQKIQEARTHLAVALVQVHPSDDQIIVEHMRAAHDALDAVLLPRPSVAQAPNGWETIRTALDSLKVS